MASSPDRMSLEDKLYPFLSLYDRLPSRLKWGLGFAFRQLPESVRQGKHYREFKDLAEAGELWQPAQIAEYQLTELRRTLDHANRFCPYYQRRFAEAGFRPERVQAPEDMQGCPLLEKRDVIEHREQMASTAFGPSDRLYITTSGTTGVPVGFYLQKGISRAKEHAFMETMWKRGGYFDGARMAMLRAHVTSLKASGRISSYDATRDWLVLSSYHLTADRLPLYLEELERFKPDLLYTFASTIVQLAEYLESSGQQWRVPLRGVLCSSERFTVQQRRVVERVFKCRAYTWYGHSERVALAAWGRQSDLYYFVPQYGFVEFGPPDAQGLREVIGTTFHNLVMPLIRYRTGDYVRLAQDGAAKLEFPWIAATDIAGREQEFIYSGTGRKISFSTLNMHDDIFDGLYTMQFIQEQPGRLELCYVAGPAFDPAKLPVIEAGLRRKLGDDFELTLRPVPDVERTSQGKHKWLVSRLAPQPAQQPVGRQP
jgi:phenylacetate-CoA ligase